MCQMQFFKFEGYLLPENSTFLWLFQNYLTTRPHILKVHSLHQQVVWTQPLVLQVSLSLDSSFSYISNMSRDLISSSSLILFKSFASLIVVALYTNLGGKDLRAFFHKLLFWNLFPKSKLFIGYVAKFSIEVIDSLFLTHPQVLELFYKQF